MSSKPFFRTPERIARLLFHAETWRGTPWCANSSAKGTGVACHNLPRAIYMEVSALPQDFPAVMGRPDSATARNEMETFLDSRPEFGRIRPSPSVPMPSLLLPGDLVGLFLAMDSLGRRIKERTVNHLGVILAGGNFAHVLMHKNTDFDLIAVPPWSQRLIAAWRPMEIV